MTKKESDRAWLNENLERLNMTMWRVAIDSGAVTRPDYMYRILDRESGFSPRIRAILADFFATATPIRRLDMAGLRERLMATGLAASQIRTHAGVSRESACRVFDGRTVTPEVFDRLTAWLDAGAPLKPPKAPRAHVNHKPRVACGEAFVRRMLSAGMRFVYRDGSEARIEGNGDYLKSSGLAYHAKPERLPYYRDDRMVQE